MVVPRGISTPRLAARIRSPLTMRMSVTLDCPWQPGGRGNADSDHRACSTSADIQHSTIHGVVLPGYAQMFPLQKLMSDWFRTKAAEEREEEKTSHQSPCGTAGHAYGRTCRREEHQREDVRRDYDRVDVPVCAAGGFQDQTAETARASSAPMPCPSPRQWRRRWSTRTW